MRASKINLIVDAFHTRYRHQGSFQNVPEVERWDTAANGEYALSEFKLEIVHPTTKMVVTIDAFAGTMFRVGASILTGVS